MNPEYLIYHAPEDEIPAEDKARFDGYAKGFEDAKKALNDAWTSMGDVNKPGWPDPSKPPAPNQPAQSPKEYEVGDPYP